ncbi:MAG: DUF424 family protein [Candidatus Helarchaeota archaeon]|nr:DUF424 family protein [Candidatus Helarchaeota archaeon]
MQVYMKIKKVRDDLLVAISDANLLGKCFKDGNRKIEVKSDFYGNELVSIEKGIKELERATIGNLVGRYIVTHAIKAGFVHKDSVIWIEGVPHAQIISF